MSERVNLREHQPRSDQSSLLRLACLPGCRPYAEKRGCRPASGTKICL